MTRAARALVTDVRAALAAIADPKKAPAMQRYMKSSMPYLGVPTPPLRRTCRVVFARHPLDGPDEWRDAILMLWRGATHREHETRCDASLGDSPLSPICFEILHDVLRRLLED